MILRKVDKIAMVLLLEDMQVASNSNFSDEETKYLIDLIEKDIEATDG